jgi:ribosomal protein S18 acetylase RimI-like enzyme
MNSPAQLIDSERNLGTSEESQTIIDCLTDLARDYHVPVSRQYSTVAQRFYNLASQWFREVTLTTSVTEICVHPAYQQIIGIGPEVTPFLLRELKREPIYWFWALRAVTGADPVQPSDRGNIDQMVSAWQSWGKEEGYIW